MVDQTWRPPLKCGAAGLQFGAAPDAGRGQVRQPRTSDPGSGGSTPVRAASTCLNPCLRLNVGPLRPVQRPPHAFFCPPVPKPFGAPTTCSCPCCCPPCRIRSAHLLRRVGQAKVGRTRTNIFRRGPRSGGDHAPAATSARSRTRAQTAPSWSPWHAASGRTSGRTSTRRPTGTTGGVARPPTPSVQRDQHAVVALAHAAPHVAAEHRLAPDGRTG